MNFEIEKNCYKNKYYNYKNKYNTEHDANLMKENVITNLQEKEKKLENELLNEDEESSKKNKNKLFPTKQ